MSDTSTPSDRIWGYAAEFTSPAGITVAAKKVAAAGYKWWDCHVPFPVHGLDTVMGVKPTILPIMVFFGGLTGFALAWFLQIFTNSLQIDIWAIVPVVGVVPRRAPVARVRVGARASVRAGLHARRPLHRAVARVRGAGPARTAAARGVARGAVAAA